MSVRIIYGTQASYKVEDASQVGECRRAAQRLAQTFNFNETCVARVGIVATELANNLLRHAGSGELLIQGLDDGVESQIEMIAIDRGPGMADVERCLRDGYSTGGTAGTGLGAVARLSTVFDIYSVVGMGTVVLSRVANRTADLTRDSLSNDIEFGAVCIPVHGEVHCGDTWRIATDGAQLGALVVDGLGHGTLAADAAQAAAEAFQTNPLDEPSDLLQRMHRALGGTRGAAAACAVLDRDRAKIRYGGVGNVAGSLLAEDRSRGMVSHNGTLGVKLLKIQQFDYDWPAGSRVAMHSDGLSARWSIATYPGLSLRHCAIIAAVLYRDQRRVKDDVTVLLVGARA